DDLIVEDLIENAIQASADELKDAKVIAVSEPFLIKRLINENASVTGINVTLHFPEEDISEVPTAVNYARELASKYEELYPDLKIYITGVAMMNNSFSEASQNDMSSLIPLMFFAMFLIMFFSLRSASSTFATIIIVMFSMMSAMGLAGWFNTGITPPSAQAPTIIMTLAIADSIHILVIMLKFMAKGMSKIDAIKESVRVNFQPVFLTSLSTVVGFLTMNFIDVPPFHHLGNITSAGVTAAFLFSVITLPALMAVLPVKVKLKDKNESTSTFMEKLAEFVIKNKNPLFYASLGTAVIVSLFVIRNELNDSFVNYFDESIDFRVATDYTTENLTGIYQVQFSLNASESGGISEPEYLATVEEFAQWYRDQENVLHVSSFTDVMKRLNKNMHADDESYYRVPQDRDLAAQYLLLYEMSLPYGLDLNNQINVDKSATRFTVTLEDVTSKEIISAGDKGEQWLIENAPEYMHAVGSSPALMFSNISRLNVQSMIKGSILALFLISMIMVFALRNWKIGSLSLIPNLMPAAVGFGLWGMTSGRIDLGLSVVMGMTLGIVVDDSIHFLSKYLRARREDNLGPEDAVRYAFNTVGKALTVTTFILAIGFTILSFSAFSMNSNMAKLTSITIVIALIADFIFLPPLLIKFESWKPLVKNRESKLTSKPVFAKGE
ncbi:MAG: MMPL family transporter, partial [Melioribacteraceae bacterium]|nr:MMPL family transporter [Melioribacteraceae bacterium]